MTPGLLAGGAVIAAATVMLAWIQPDMGTPAFMALVLAAISGYLIAISSLGAHSSLPTWAIVACLLAAVAWRAPLVTASDGYSTDTIRYIWDARVQRAGLSPYTTRPEDPAAAHVHSELTRHVDVAWLPTIYPPVAQWYFRAVTAPAESAAAFRIAALAADLLIAMTLWAILLAVGRPPGWVLAYAWHPLVPFEATLGGHLDIAGVLALALAWLGLIRKWPAVAAVAFTCAVLIKPLPIVLAPLFWRRIGVRHFLLAAAVASVATFALPGGEWPVGSMPDFIDEFRFNSPLFHALSPIVGPRAMAGVAVLAGLGTAAFLRARRTAAPDAWIWPLTAALLLAPVIYPWYLLWLLPFLVLGGRHSWPVGAWTLSIAAVYPTWHLAAGGARWAVPAPLVAVEYGLPLLVAAVVLIRTWPWTQGPRPAVNHQASA